MRIHGGSSLMERVPASDAVLSLDPPYFAKRHLTRRRIWFYTAFGAMQLVGWRRAWRDSAVHENNIHATTHQWWPPSRIHFASMNATQYVAHQWWLPSHIHGGSSLMDRVGQ